MRPSSALFAASFAVALNSGIVFGLGVQSAVAQTADHEAGGGSGKIGANEVQVSQAQTHGRAPNKIDNGQVKDEIFEGGQSQAGTSKENRKVATQGQDTAPPQGDQAAGDTRQKVSTKVVAVTRNNCLFAKGPRGSAVLS